jgi:membrane-bound lytic murein transglycosylase A
MSKISIFLIAVIFIIYGCSSPARKTTPLPSLFSVPKILPNKKIPSRIALPLTLVAKEDVPYFTDDMDKESLSEAIEKSLQYYRKIAGKVQYRIGDSLLGIEDLQESLLALREIFSGNETDDKVQSLIRENFDVYLSTGFDGNRPALFTGYFEPVLRGSLVKTEKYKYPIYGIPEDAVRVNLQRFGEEFGEKEIIGRIKNGELIPYYNRSQIDNQGVLAGKNLEIIWVDDPIELFFLHIQGSGKIELENGETCRIGYALKNGRPYKSIGKYMLQTGKVTPGGTIYQGIKRYLKEHPQEHSEILGQNESYVFFRFVEKGPVGSIGVVLTPGRSIATDASAFPPGALAFIKTSKPNFDNNGNIVSWKPFSRFVISQDAGSAIKGAGRVDLFCGGGVEAEMLAGSLKEQGKLYFLLKKK